MSDSLTLATSIGLPVSRDVAGQALAELEHESARTSASSCPRTATGLQLLAVEQVDAAVVVVDQHPQLVDDRLADRRRRRSAG